MKNYTKGFTVIELMIVVVMVAILSFLGNSGFKQIALSNKVSSLSMDFVGTLRLAQSEAIRRGTKVSIAPNTTTQWEDGWDIFVDASTKGVKDGDDEIIKTYSPKFNRSTLRSGNTVFSTYISFLPNGAVTGNGGANGNFRLCPPSEDKNISHTIEIERSGNISSEKNTLSCP